LFHLVVADVFTKAAHSDFKLFWVIGKPESAKWLEAFLVDKRSSFTVRATPWSGSWKGTAHVIWSWEGENNAGGMYHVERTKGAFGSKTQIFDGAPRGWDCSIDASSGRLLLVLSNDRGVFVVSKKPGSQWSKPSQLLPELSRRHDVSIRSRDNGDFEINTKATALRRFLLHPE
jgi:hypothetical protein